VERYADTWVLVLLLVQLRHGNAVGGRRIGGCSEDLGP